MKKFSACIGLLVCALQAAAVSFPLCMYGVNNPEDVSLLKQAGFTCIQTYQKDPALLAKLAKAAKDNHMQVVFYPNQVIGSEYQKAATKWPVLAWYLVDEPDVWSWTREKVSQQEEKAKTAFPKHDTTLVIGQGKTAVSYYDLTDTLLMDWYPVPHLDLTSFGDNVRWAKEGQIAAGVAERPLWGVVQLFDWKEFKQHRPDHDRIGRFPTEDELRFMSFDGIVNGATGLFYFIFTTNGKPLPQAQPEWWNRMVNVSKQLAKLRPILEEGTVVENPAQVNKPLAAKTYAYKRHTYTILLNRSDKAVKTPAAFLDPSYRILFGLEKTAEIPPYGTWIFQKK